MDFDKATAGHLAADIRRAVARLDRAVILWGQRALEDGDWSGAAAAALIQRRCDALVWAKERAWRWSALKSEADRRPIAVVLAMRIANASITRATPFLVESVGPLRALPTVADTARNPPRSLPG
jgi:hypothetical protein